LRNAIEKIGGAFLDSTLNSTTNNNQLNTTTTTTNSNSSISRTPTRQSSRKATNTTTVETIEPAFKTTKELDDGNGFEISISNGTQEPILKVSNPNASKIIIEKTTTTITTTPKQSMTSSSTVLADPLPTTTTTTTTTSLADSYRNIRTSDSPSRIAPAVSTRNSNIFNNPDEFRSSSRLSDVLPPSSSLSSSNVVRPTPAFQPVRTSTAVSSTITPSPIQRRDKFAERLENYGLLRDEDNVETLSSRIPSRITPSVPTSTKIESSSSSRVPIVSPTNIRSRQPLHSERSSSYGFTSYSAKPESQAFSQPAAQATVAKNSGINWRLIGLVAVVTAVAYIFIMYLQVNPENPIA
jgi:hypothetical protein